jgi:ABC-type phosphate transport system substrate-binding protein
MLVVNPACGGLVDRQGHWGASSSLFCAVLLLTACGSDTDARIDFAGSDFPLAEGKEQQAADARCKSGPAINIPMVGGPIAVGYNVPGLTKSLNLSASTLAKT